nr:DNA ligase D [Methylotenera sp.]
TQDIAAFKKPPKGYEARGVHWLEPKLVAEINFAEWTADGILRHASFIEMRNDKPAEQIVREIPASIKVIESEEPHPMKEPPPALKPTPTKHLESRQPRISKPSAINVVHGITISHPERIIYTPENITKIHVAEYYEAAEKWLMPHLKGRPLSLLRCPDGTEKECFFQKHLDDFKLKNVQKIDVDANDKGKYLIANNIAGVIELVQMGVIELHTWGSTTKVIHNPDRFIFDLDPDPSVPWEKVIEGANLVRYLLENMRLESFLKTTGGKGLHIVVPIKPDHEFPVIKAFTKSIAMHLTETIPTHFVAVMSKEKRKNKIFIDYLRNGEEATAIAAYSLRARPGAPISVPLRWDELNVDLKSDTFNMLNIYERLLNLSKDPWENYFTTQQVITKEMLKTFE